MEMYIVFVLYDVFLYRPYKKLHFNSLKIRHEKCKFDNKAPKNFKTTIPNFLKHKALPTAFSFSFYFKIKNKTFI